MQSVIQVSNPTRATASGLIWTGAGALAGIFVASASAASITVVDGLTGSGKLIVNTFTPAAATWYAMPFFFAAGLFITIAGTIDCTVGVGPVSS